jgi:ASC-1-like (ASCH) protein
MASRVNRYGSSSPEVTVRTPKRKREDKEVFEKKVWDPNSKVEEGPKRRLIYKVTEEKRMYLQKSNSDSRTVILLNKPDKSEHESKEHEEKQVSHAKSSQLPTKDTDRRIVRGRRRDTRASSFMTHNLPMSGTQYLKYIKDGVKKFEGRVNGPLCRKMRVGDRLKLYSNRDQWGIICEITSLDTYSSFREMVVDKGAIELLPQLKERELPRKELIDAAVKIYDSFPGAQRSSRNGVIAIGVKYLKDC